MTIDAAAAGLLDPRPELVTLLSLTADGGLDADRARQLVRVGQALYPFWHTGDMRWLHEAAGSSFTDRILLPGRPQGTDGPAAASATRPPGQR
jgi:hypothetical protein